MTSHSDRRHNSPIFWTRESTSANAEIDLVLVHKQRLIPVEIKSGPKESLKSLHEFIDRCPHNLGVRLLANRFSLERSVTRSGKEYWLINLPFYSIAKITEWIDYVEETLIEMLP